MTRETDRSEAVAGPRSLTREEAVEKALLFTFQLSGKDYRKMQAALSEIAFIRALEQDGYTVAALRPEREEAGLHRPTAAFEDGSPPVCVVDDETWPCRAALAAPSPQEIPAGLLDFASRVAAMLDRGAESAQALIEAYDDLANEARRLVARAALRGTGAEPEQTGDTE